MGSLYRCNLTTYRFRRYTSQSELSLFFRLFIPQLAVRNSFNLIMFRKKFIKFVEFESKSIRSSFKDPLYAFNEQYLFNSLFNLIHFQGSSE